MGLGGMGAALGGLFGGGGNKAAAAAPMADKKDPVDPGQPTDTAEPPPDDPNMGGGEENPFAGITLPPAMAKGGGCQEVADRIEQIIVVMFQAQVGEMDAETKKLVEAQMGDAIPQMKAQMLQMCEAQHWPQELKDCVLTAATPGDLEGCEQYVTEEMKNSEMTGGIDEPTEPAEPPPPEQPAPAWSGGDDCGAVGQRIVQLAINQAGDMPDDQKKMMEEAMAEAASQIVDACTQGQWSAEVRTCFLKSGTIQDAEVCFQNVGGM
jgi:hypothetical protein